MNLNLSSGTLMRIWEHAMVQFKDKDKDPHEPMGIHLARCWVYAFNITLLGEGYKVCVSKDGKEILL